MNARDLPGFGDLTNRHHPQSPDYLGDPLDESETTIEQFREWADSFIAAAEAKDKRRMEQCSYFVQSLIGESPPSGPRCTGSSRPPTKRGRLSPGWNTQCSTGTARRLTRWR